MELTINTISLSILIVLEIALYLILCGRLLPSIVKVCYPFSESTDRGLHKYTYPNGRGVSYEVRPSIRKYINRYVLFTNNGYKYLKCRLDDAVSQMEYSVVMFDRRNRVIDVLDVETRQIENAETEEVLLHPDTSYVMLDLTVVNHTELQPKKKGCYKLSRIAIYVGGMMLASFLQLVFAKWALDVYDAWYFHAAITEGIGLGDLILPSVLIGLVAGGMLFLNSRAKGVKWSR